MAQPINAGWRSFRFWYGSFDSAASPDQSEQREIADSLARHADEIAHGGWRGGFPSLDELDQQ